MVLNAPRRLTSIVRSHATGSVSASGPNDAMPAFAHTASRRPWRSSTVATTCSQASPSVTSSGRTSPLGVDVGEHRRPAAPRELGRGRGADAARAAGDQDDLHASALMPVSARPMISFWICDVPS